MEGIRGESVVLSSDPKPCCAFTLPTGAPVHWHTSANSHARQISVGVYLYRRALTLVREGIIGNQWPKADSHDLSKEE